MCTSRATPALDDGAFEPPGPPDALSGTNRPPTDHQPTTNRAPTDHRPSTDRAPTDPRPRPSPLGHWHGFGRAKSVTARPLTPAARRALPGSAPKAPPQPAGPLAWFRSGKVRHSPSPHPGFAKGAARLPREALAGFVAFAKGPGRCREGALAGFRARPWPVSRRALAGFAKGPWPWPLKGPGRLREGALAGSAPRPRPSPLGHWRAFGLAKSVAARRPTPAARCAFPPSFSRCAPSRTCSVRAAALPARDRIFTSPCRIARITRITRNLRLLA